MPVKTRADLSTEVLRKLKVVDGTSAPDAADLTKVAETWECLHAECRQRFGLPAWGSDAVPLYAYLSCIDIVADYLSPDYGVQEVDLYSARGTEAINRLIGVCSVPYTGHPLWVDYF